MHQNLGATPEKPGFLGLRRDLEIAYRNKYMYTHL